MNHFFKSTLTILGLAASLNLSAQHIHHHIPKNASIAFTLNGGDLLQKNVKTENNRLYYKFIGEILDDYRWDKLLEHGINIDKEAVGYFLIENQFQYFTLVFAISDPILLSQFLSEKFDVISTDNNGNLYAYAGTQLWYWNKEVLKIVNSELDVALIAKDKSFASYDIKHLNYDLKDSIYASYESKYERGEITVPDDWSPKYYYNDYFRPTTNLKQAYNDAEVLYNNEYETIEMSDEYSIAEYYDNSIVATEITEEPTTVEFVEKYDEDAYESEAWAAVDSAVAASEMYESDLDDEDDDGDEILDNYISYLTDSLYHDMDYLNDSLISVLRHDMALKHAQVQFCNNAISEMKYFKKYYDAKAFLNVYVNNNTFYNNDYFKYFMGFSNNLGAKTLNPDEHTFIKSYLNDQEIKTDYVLIPDARNRALYKSIYKRKINKDFFKYLNTNTDIAFTSHLFNTANVLKVMPEQIKHYTKFFDDGAIDIVTDLFSLVIDEDAIGNVYRGDGLLILRGLSNKNYTYTTYEYDDDFEMKEVTKEKNEVLPDFTYMFSYKDAKLTRKILNYLVKKDWIQTQHGIYTFKDKSYSNLPYELYILVKDGIIFMSTNKAEINSIATNSFQSYSTCKTRKAIKKHAQYLYFNPALAVNKYQSEDLEFDGYINKVLYNMGVTEVKAQKMKCKTLKGTWKQSVPSKYDNSATYILELAKKWFTII